MSLKSKCMTNILNLVTQQLKKIEKHLLNGEKVPNISALETILFEQINSMTNNYFHTLSNGLDNLHMKISKILEEIQNISTSNMDNNKIDESKLQLVIATSLEDFQCTLKNMENQEYNEIKNMLQVTHNYVRKMSERKQLEDGENIKELGLTLLSIVESLQTHVKNFVSQSSRRKTILCLSQTIVGFSMLVNLVQEQYKIQQTISTTKQYICTRICQCLQIIIGIFDNVNPSETEELSEKEEHFVYKMDQALDLTSELPKNNAEKHKNMCHDLWLIIEEVFSHAMLIAQVCEQENFDAISGTCRAVISEFDNLKTQLSSEKPDNSLNILFINAFTDALYRLERRVNIAVLSLVMEVFTNPFEPLKKLIRACGSSLPASDRCLSDLDTSDFDIMTDKMMQIGLYAVACCSDINRVMKIKNHLASLESLELELISTIKAFYQNPDNLEFQTGAKLLTTQYQQEVNSFYKALGLIIDIAAYCQVVWDDLQLKTQAMNDCLDNHHEITLEQVKLVVHRSCTLTTLMTVAIDDIGHKNIDKATIMMIRELKAAIFETDAAAKSLLVSNLTDPKQLRVIKRCELILDVMKRLQPVLQIVINNSDSAELFNNTNFSTCRSDGTFFTYVKTPYSVKSCKPPVSFQSPKNVPKEPPSMTSLIPYIEKGREMRLERSIIYRQPLKSNNSSLSRKIISPKNFFYIRQHLFCRNSFIVEDNFDLSCVSLNLTEILDNVSTLSIYQRGGNADRQSMPFRKMLMEVETNFVENQSAIGNDDAIEMISIDESEKNYEN